MISFNKDSVNFDDSEAGAKFGFCDDLPWESDPYLSLRFQGSSQSFQLVEPSEGNDTVVLTLLSEAFVESVIFYEQVARGLAPSAADRAKFQTLVAEWKSGRGHSSKTIELVSHPAYQQIIGMGKPAIPLLLEEMKARPSHWSWALSAITREDPVPRSSRGKLKEVVEHWLKWGVEHGYAV